MAGYRSFRRLFSKEGNSNRELIGDRRGSSGRRIAAKSGYTVIELMLTMGILALISNIMLPAINNLYQLRQSVRTYYQDEIGVYQLQIALACGDIDKVKRDSISYHTSESDCIIHIVNNKLISQPGTVDYIHGIDEVRFEVFDNVIYMYYERDGNELSWPIAYEKP